MSAIETRRTAIVRDLAVQHRRSVELELKNMEGDWIPFFAIARFVMEGRVDWGERLMNFEAAWILFVPGF